MDLSRARAIDPTFGPTVQGDYWSSTTTAALPNLAWQVDFSDSDAGGNIKELDFYVHAVRRGS